jgi:hypothetical protein
LVLIAPELNHQIHYASQVFQEAKGDGKIGFWSFTLEEVIATVRLCDSEYADAPFLQSNLNA